MTQLITKTLDHVYDALEAHEKVRVVYDAMLVKATRMGVRR